MFNGIIPVGEEILESATMKLEFKDQNGVFANFTYDPGQENNDEIEEDIFEKISQNHHQKSFRWENIWPYDFANTLEFRINV